jgi:hypothetical protein
MAGTKPASSVSIPRSISAATARLVDLESIATATGWERAAIVYAFTEDGRGASPGSRSLTFADFAALGIAGLRNKDTVARYHRIWAEAIGMRKAKKVKPGDTARLPATDFPPDEANGNLGSRITVPAVVRHIEREPEFIDRVIRESPVAQRAARRQVLNGPSLSEKFGPAPEPDVDDVMFASIAAANEYRAVAHRAMANLAEAVEVAYAAMAELDSEDRERFAASVENIVGRVAMLAAMVEGAPDDVSALEAGR